MNSDLQIKDLLELGSWHSEQTAVHRKRLQSLKILKLELKRFYSWHNSAKREIANPMSLYRSYSEAHNH